MKPLHDSHCTTKPRILTKKWTILKPFFCLQSNTKSIEQPIEFKKKDVKQSVMPLPWLSGASGASFPRYPCHSCDSAQYFRCSKIEISKQPLRQGLCRAKGLNLEKGANKAQIFGQKGDGDWSFSSPFVAVWMTGYSCTTSVGLGRQTLSSGSCPRSVDQRRWLRTSENRVFHSHHTQFVDSTPWIELRSWGWKEKTCKLTAGTVRNSHVYYDSSDDLWWPDTDVDTPIILRWL